MIRDAYGSEVLGLDGIFDWCPGNSITGRQAEPQRLNAYRFYFTDCFDSPSWLVVCNGADVRYLTDAMEVWIEHLAEHAPGCLIQPFEQDDYLDENGEITGVDFGPSGEMLDAECWGAEETHLDYAQFTYGECRTCGKIAPECTMRECYGVGGWWGLYCSEECAKEGW